MNAKIENTENNVATITFEVGPEKLEDGMKYSYEKNKKKINVPGFRKGKVPRKIIEMQFGAEIFYDDAFNYILPDAYKDAIQELKLEAVSRPEIDVVEVSKDTGVKFTADVTIKPEVTLGQYKGIEVSREEVSVSDEEVMTEINIAREKNARIITVSHRPAQMEDIVTIDFEGFIDDEAFEGGKDSDYELVLGSQSFIDDFEEQLVGHSVGDNVEIHATFPENYQQEDLAGKTALFKVTIKNIKYKEFPEIDDDFAQDVSEFDTLDAYKNDIREKKMQIKSNQEDLRQKEEALKKVLESASMDVPQIMIEKEIVDQFNNFSNNVRLQGMSIDMFAQYMGQSVEQLKESFHPQAEEAVKSRLVLEAIAKAENCEAPEEELEAEIKKMAENYQIDLEQMESILDEEKREMLKNDLKAQKALDIIMQHSVKK